MPRPPGRSTVPGNNLQMGNDWGQQPSRADHGDNSRNVPYRHGQGFGNFIGQPGDHTHRPATFSDRSGSANEVEQMLKYPARNPTINHLQSGWQFGPQGSRPAPRGALDRAFPGLFHPLHRDSFCAANCDKPAASITRFSACTNAEVDGLG